MMRRKPNTTNRPPPSAIFSIAGVAFLSRIGVDFAATLGGTTFDFASSDYIVIPGVLVSMTLLVVVSLLTEPSPREKWEPFFRPPEETVPPGAEPAPEG